MALLATNVHPHSECVLPLRIRAWIAVTRAAVLTAMVLGPLAASPTRAEEPAPLGHTASGLTGIDTVVAVTSAPGTVVSAALSYGVTESAGTYAGVHQRFGANVGVAYTPLAWLSVAGQLLGRLDTHPNDAQGKDRTGTGDPLLTLRAGRNVHGRTALGAALTAWVPGLHAPSFVLRASTFELRLLQQTEFPKRKLTLLSNLGFRLDESAHAVPPRDRVRVGDRIALGVSDFNGLPWGLGAVHHFRKSHAFFAELSGLLLLTSQSDALRSSPLRVAAGTRNFLKQGLEVEGGVRVSLSPKPSFASGAAFVPFEPRVLVHVALRWDSARLQEQRAQRLARAAAEEVEATPAAEPALAAIKVHGRVVDENAAALPDCAVLLTVGEASYETITAFDGSFDFSELDTLGAANLSIRARGYAPRTLPLTLVRGTLEVPVEALERATAEGLLRMAVRSFKSDALTADIVIKDAHGRDVIRAHSDAAGQFETALPPGTYRVTTSAKGYTKQSRAVRIAADEVAIINVDLRETRAR